MHQYVPYFSIKIVWWKLWVRTFQIVSFNISNGILENNVLSIRLSLIRGDQDRV